MRKFIGAAFVSSILLSSGAWAADIPMKAPVRPVMAPVYNWTGCHIGGNVGGKWARTSGSVDVGATAIPGPLGAAGSVLIPAADATTIIAGGQVGCDYQTGNWVFGLEGDFDWHRWSRTTTLVGAQPFPFIAGDNFDVRSRWQASARGRIGYAWDRLLVYATGGGAFTNLTVGTNFIAVTAGGVTFPATVVSDTKTVAGWTFGGGFEYAFVNNWSFGVEGRYSWYGTHQFNAGALATVFTPSTAAPPGTFTFAPASQTIKLETFEVMAKLNWKFM